MLNISINIGSYSIKFLTFKVERKKIIYQNSKEVILDSDEFNILEDDIVLDLQMKIISDFLEEIEDEYKVILNASNEIINERFIELPIKNKKKANLMLPFQLEEDIPYSLSECKISNTLELTKTGSRAVVNIIKHSVLQPLYQKISDYKINPSILTSEISAVESFVRNTSEVLPQAFCIMDIGHSTTHAYFFIDGKLQSSHTSYVAGFAINDIISKTYNINLEEAAIYKHQNSYFLASDQYSEVDESQRQFAKLMDETFASLISDFQRWHIGFRVQNGLPVTDIFLIGGSSNIKNIKNFLSEKTNIKIGQMDFFTDTIHDKVDTDEKQKRKFALSSMQSHGLVNKSKVINFLTGEYAIQGDADLPVHSMFFIGSRLLFLTLILLVSLSIESIFLSKQITSADKKLRGLVKNPILGLSPRESRSAIKKPKPILARLSRKEKIISQEVKVLQSSVNTNALKSLQVITDYTAGLNIEVVEYTSVSGSDFLIKFKGNTPKDINDLNDVLKTSRIKNLFVDFKPENKTLTLNGSEQ